MRPCGSPENWSQKAPTIQLTPSGGQEASKLAHPRGYLIGAAPEQPWKKAKSQHAPTDEDGGGGDNDGADDAPASLRKPDQSRYPVASAGKHLLWSCSPSDFVSDDSDGDKNDSSCDSPLTAVKLSDQIQDKDKKPKIHPSQLTKAPLPPAKSNNKPRLRSSSSSGASLTEEAESKLRGLSCGDTLTSSEVQRAVRRTMCGLHAGGKNGGTKEVNVFAYTVTVIYRTD